MYLVLCTNNINIYIFVSQVSGRAINSNRQLHPIARAPRARVVRKRKMGKKKGGVKKKKKKGVKKGSKGQGALGDLETQVLVPEFVQQYVTIHCKLVNWVFLDFTLKDVCINNTKLYSIRRKIKERHGRISNLRVYHGSMQPQTEMKDEMLTLEQLGVEGLNKIGSHQVAGVDGEVPQVETKRAEVTFWYDFKPFAHSDPLLLR